MFKHRLLFTLEQALLFTPVAEQGATVDAAGLQLITCMPPVSCRASLSASLEEAEGSDAEGAASGPILLASLKIPAK